MRRDPDEDVMKALERKEDVQEWVMQSLKARIKKIKGQEMKVYISGPVTGTDDYVERFQKAEDESVRAGLHSGKPGCGKRHAAGGNGI